MNEPFDPVAAARPTTTAVEPAPMAVGTSASSGQIATTRATTSAFLPILILSLVLLAWFAFQAFQLRTERDAMQVAMAGQDREVIEAKKLRDSLDAIARGTAQLADGGNANARLIVDELKKRGVTISPTEPMTTPGTTAPTPAAR